MTLGRSPLGGLLRKGDGLADDCCCDDCCCPGMTLDKPGVDGARLLWSITSTCGLSGDLHQISQAADPCTGTYGQFQSETKSLGTCDTAAPITVSMKLTCEKERGGPLCSRYRLDIKWGNSGCFGAASGPLYPESGCDCDPFYLVFKLPCPQGAFVGCKCAAGTITIVVTRLS